MKRAESAECSSGQGANAEPAKDPLHVGADPWFTEARLEKFAACLAEVPFLWSADHLTCKKTSIRALAYKKLLESLGEPTKERLCVPRAMALCRVFLGLLQHQLQWAANESQARGAKPGEALGLCPSWARLAESYLQLMPDVLSRLQPPDHPASTEEQPNVENASTPPLVRNDNSDRENEANVTKTANVAAPYSNDCNSDKESEKNTTNVSTASYSDDFDNDENEPEIDIITIATEPHTNDVNSEQETEIDTDLRKYATNIMDALTVPFDNDFDCDQEAEDNDDLRKPIITNTTPLCINEDKNYNETETNTTNVLTTPCVNDENLYNEFETNIRNVSATLYVNNGNSEKESKIDITNVSTTPCNNYVKIDHEPESNIKNVSTTTYISDDKSNKNEPQVNLDSVSAASLATIINSNIEIEACVDITTEPLVINDNDEENEATIENVSTTAYAAIDNSDKETEATIENLTTTASSVIDDNSDKETEENFDDVSTVPYVTNDNIEKENEEIVDNVPSARFANDNIEKENEASVDITTAPLGINDNNDEENEATIENVSTTAYTAIDNSDKETEANVDDVSTSPCATNENSEKENEEIVDNVPTALCANDNIEKENECPESLLTPIDPLLPDTSDDGDVPACRQSVTQLCRALLRRWLDLQDETKLRLRSHIRHHSHPSEDKVIPVDISDEEQQAVEQSNTNDMVIDDVCQELRDDLSKNDDGKSKCETNVTMKEINDIAMVLSGNKVGAGIERDEGEHHRSRMKDLTISNEVTERNADDENPSKKIKHNLYKDTITIDVVPEQETDSEDLSKDVNEGNSNRTVLSVIEKTIDTVMSEEKLEVDVRRDPSNLMHASQSKDKVVYDKSEEEIGEHNPSKHVKRRKSRIAVDLIVKEKKICRKRQKIRIRRDRCELLYRTPTKHVVSDDVPDIKKCDSKTFKSAVELIIKNTANLHLSDGIESGGQALVKQNHSKDVVIDDIHKQPGDDNSTDLDVREKIISTSRDVAEAGVEITRNDFAQRSLCQDMTVFDDISYQELKNFSKDNGDRKSDTGSITEDVKEGLVEVDIPVPNPESTDLREQFEVKEDPLDPVVNILGEHYIDKNSPDIEEHHVNESAPSPQLNISDENDVDKHLSSPGEIILSRHQFNKSTADIINELQKVDISNIVTMVDFDSDEENASLDIEIIAKVNKNNKDINTPMRQNSYNLNQSREPNDDIENDSNKDTENKKPTKVKTGSEHVNESNKNHKFLNSNNIKHKKRRRRESNESDDENLATDNDDAVCNENYFGGSSENNNSTNNTNLMNNDEVEESNDGYSADVNMSRRSSCDNAGVGQYDFEVKVVGGAFDPKLLMRPVVVINRFTDPISDEFFTTRHLSPPPRRRPTASYMSPSSRPLNPRYKSPSPLTTSRSTPYAPAPKSVQKKRAWKKLCNSKKVLMNEEKGAKRVNLPDIEEVRRNNKNMLTAQVTPITQRQGGLDAASCGHDKSPDKSNSTASVASSPEGCSCCAAQRLASPRSPDHGGESRRRRTAAARARSFITSFAKKRKRRGPQRLASRPADDYVSNEDVQTSREFVLLQKEKEATIKSFTHFTSSPNDDSCNLEEHAQTTHENAQETTRNLSPVPQIESQSEGLRTGGLSTAHQDKKKCVQKFTSLPPRDAPSNLIKAVPTQDLIANQKDQEKNISVTPVKFSEKPRRRKRKRRGRPRSSVPSNQNDCLPTPQNDQDTTRSVKRVTNVISSPDAATSDHNEDLPTPGFTTGHNDQDATRSPKRTVHLNPTACHDAPSAINKIVSVPDLITNQNDQENNSSVKPVELTVKLQRLERKRRRRERIPSPDDVSSVLDVSEPTPDLTTRSTNSVVIPDQNKNVPTQDLAPGRSERVTSISNLKRAHFTTSPSAGPSILKNSVPKYKRIVIQNRQENNTLIKTVKFTQSRSEPQSSTSRLKRVHFKTPPPDTVPSVLKDVAPRCNLIVIQNQQEKNTSVKTVKFTQSRSEPQPSTSRMKRVHFRIPPRDATPSVLKDVAPRCNLIVIQKQQEKNTSVKPVKFAVMSQRRKRKHQGDPPDDVSSVLDQGVSSDRIGGTRIRLLKATKQLNINTTRKQVAFAPSVSGDSDLDNFTYDDDTAPSVLTESALTKSDLTTAQNESNPLSLNRIDLAPAAPDNHSLLKKTALATQNDVVKALGVRRKSADCRLADPSGSIVHLTEEHKQQKETSNFGFKPLLYRRGGSACDSSVLNKGVPTGDLATAPEQESPISGSGVNEVESLGTVEDAGRWTDSGLANRSLTVPLSKDNVANLIHPHVEPLYELASDRCNSYAVSGITEEFIDEFNEPNSNETETLDAPDEFNPVIVSVQSLAPQQELTNEISRMQTLTPDSIVQPRPPAITLKQAEPDCTLYLTDSSNNGQVVIPDHPMNPQEGTEHLPEMIDVASVVHCPPAQTYDQINVQSISRVSGSPDKYPLAVITLKRPKPVRASYQTNSSTENQDFSSNSPVAPQKVEQNFPKVNMRQPSHTNQQVTQNTHVLDRPSLRFIRISPKPLNPKPSSLKSSSALQVTTCPTKSTQNLPKVTLVSSGIRRLSQQIDRPVETHGPQKATQLSSLPKITLKRAQPVYASYQNSSSETDISMSASPMDKVQETHLPRVLEVTGNIHVMQPDDQMGLHLVVSQESTDEGLPNVSQLDTASTNDVVPGRISMERRQSLSVSMVVRSVQAGPRESVKTPEETMTKVQKVNPPRANLKLVEQLFAMNVYGSDSKENNGSVETMVSGRAKTTPSASWAQGREADELAVLCVGPAVWVTRGARPYLLVSERAPPPPVFALWTLCPRQGLELPASDCYSLDSPARKTVDGLFYQKMSSDPDTYAKLLVAVSDARACRELLHQGAPLKMYCLQTCQLYPLRAEVLHDPPRFIITGDAAVKDALTALKRELSLLPASAPFPSSCSAPSPVASRPCSPSILTAPAPAPSRSPSPCPATSPANSRLPSPCPATSPAASRPCTPSTDTAPSRPSTPSTLTAPSPMISAAPSPAASPAPSPLDSRPASPEPWATSPCQQDSSDLPAANRDTQPSQSAFLERVPASSPETDAILRLMADDLFLAAFRLPRARVLRLVRELRPLLPPLEPGDIDPYTKVLICLNFLGSGCDPELARPTAPRAAACAAVAQVLQALNDDAVYHKYVRFPDTARERADVKHKFYDKFLLPGVVGALGGLHVPVMAPDHDDNTHFNGVFHSLNVQIICDADARVLSVDAAHGGAAHNCALWRDHQLNCHLQFLRRKKGEKVCLLGDSSYPQQESMLTPIEEPQSEADKLYNHTHARARGALRRCLAGLRARWRCLSQSSETTAATAAVAARLVGACAALHNMAGADWPVDVEFERTERRVAAQVEAVQGSAERYLGATAGEGGAARHRGRAARSAVVRQLESETLKLRSGRRASVPPVKAPAPPPAPDMGQLIERLQRGRRQRAQLLQDLASDDTIVLDDDTESSEG